MANRNPITNLKECLLVAADAAEEADMLWLGDMLRAMTLQVMDKEQVTTLGSLLNLLLLQVASKKYTTLLPHFGRRQVMLTTPQMQEVWSALLKGAAASPNQEQRYTLLIMSRYRRASRADEAAGASMWEDELGRNWTPCRVGIASALRKTTDLSLTAIVRWMDTCLPVGDHAEQGEGLEVTGLLAHQVALAEEPLKRHQVQYCVLAE